MHPASPNSKPAKPAKDYDNMSIASTSTFSSTVGLIKSKLPISYKDYKARKESEARKKGSKIQADEKSRKFELLLFWRIGLASRERP